MAAVLEDAVTVMQARAARLRGVTRLHDPSTDEPLIVVVVDELASLTAYAERDDKRRITLGVSRTTVFELMRSGALRSVKIGAARRVSATALAEFVAELEAT